MNRLPSLYQNRMCPQMNQTIYAWQLRADESQKKQMSAASCCL
jgi:hypothetical protein